MGDPLEQLRRAYRVLSELGTVLARSSLYRSAPVGGPPGQPDYLNAVLALRPVPFTPESLLGTLLAIERRQGRERRERWAARSLDLDLLAFGDRVQDDPRLTLPHPRMMSRAFVLVPLCEIAPEWRHPGSGARACEVAAGLGGEGVIRTDLSW